MAQTCTTPVDLDVALWDREYSDGLVIPSSNRLTPAKVLTLFQEQAAFSSGGKVLDAGCGNGRNSIYLAKKGWEVSAVDASSTAVGIASLNAANHQVSERIEFRNSILNDNWEYADAEFDLILDSYVLCHYSDSEFISGYCAEMKRLIKPSGAVFSAFFSTEDSYYRQIGQRVGNDSRFLRDPNNGLCKRLYTPDELQQVFESHFDVTSWVDFRFTDICLEKPFERSILGLLLKPK